MTDYNTSDNPKNNCSLEPPFEFHKFTMQSDNKKNIIQGNNAFKLKSFTSYLYHWTSISLYLIMAISHFFLYFKNDYKTLILTLLAFRTLIIIAAFFNLLINFKKPNSFYNFFFWITTLTFYLNLYFHNYINPFWILYTEITLMILNLISSGLFYHLKQILFLDELSYSQYLLKFNIIVRFLYGVLLSFSCINVIDDLFPKSLYPSLSTLPISYWTLQSLAIIFVYHSFLMQKKYLEFFHKQFRPAVATLLIFFHFFAIIGLCKIIMHEKSLRVFLEAMGLYLLSGFGITVGSHRLWSHKSYNAKLPFRLFIMILTSLANQGSIFHWARDHRLHHKFSDKEADPHNATRGLFYSHMGWLLLKKPEIVITEGRKIDCSDLLNDPIVRIQKKLDPYWNQFFCFILPSLYGYYMYNSLWNGFFIFGAFRWVVCLHATWTINSISHMYGERPYDNNILPRENLYSSIFAVGEGWHNWHHVFPFDYAAAEGSIFTHFNPSKLIIDFGALIGQVSNRKRATKLWLSTRRKILHDISTVNPNPNDENISNQNSSSSFISNISSMFCNISTECTRKSLFRSFVNLARDILICSGIALLAVYSKQSSIGKFCTENYFLNQLVNFLLWTIYAISQGTVAFGLWVIGYEAAGGRFSDVNIVNRITGFFLHSFLLVPYKERQSLNELKRTSLMRSLKEDAFWIFKLGSFKFESISFLSLLGVSLTLLTSSLFACNYGVYRVAKWYFGPWIVLNFWMTLYCWLLENGPHDDVNQKEYTESNTLDYFTKEWLVDMWSKSTRGSKYPWTKLFDHLHHHLSLSHIIEAVNFNVPHYHAKEAFKKIGELLEELGEIVDGKSRLCSNGISMTHKFL